MRIIYYYVIPASHICTCLCYSSPSSFEDVLDGGGRRQDWDTGCAWISFDRPESLSNQLNRLLSREPVPALQGAFAEHEAILSKLRITDNTQRHRSVLPYLVKTPADLDACDALIIPGGESTTIALLARLNGLLEPLRTFSAHKPIWGTCAGAILLSNGGVVGAKKGGQEVIGGFDVRIERNGWGSQVSPFALEITDA